MEKSEEAMQTSEKLFVKPEEPLIDFDWTHGNQESSPRLWVIDDLDTGIAWL